MCAPAWPLSQLLFLVLLTVSRSLAGVVTATPSLTIGVGQPLNLSCSFTTSTDSNIHQVRWLDKHKQPLLSYLPRSPVQIFHRDPKVHLSSSDHGFSHITISSLRLEDEGCFHCVFDVYPLGQQEGQTCVTFTDKVNLKSNMTAIAGKPTTLTCSYTLPAKVQQVLWRKIEKQEPRSTLASYSNYGLNIPDMFVGKVTLNKNLSYSVLSIQEAKMEDEACYSCEFHTYPDGVKSAITCLAVYVLPKTKVNYVTDSSNVTEANCTAQSKPSAQIVWDFGGDNRTLGPPVYSSFNESNGTTTVTSTVLFKKEALSDVKCTIHHPGLDKPCVVSLTNEFQLVPANIVLLALCGVAVALLLCLCGCLCKCFVCKSD